METKKSAQGQCFQPMHASYILENLPATGVISVCKTDSLMSDCQYCQYKSDIVIIIHCNMCHTRMKGMTGIREQFLFKT